MIKIPESEYDISTTRSSGPGGQHVNKVETAVQLRFDIAASSLPERVKNRLLRLRDKRVTSSGEILIRSSRYRSQLKNKEEAIKKLHDMVIAASRAPKKRIPTKATEASKEKRLQEKKRRSEIKKMRQDPD